MTKQLPTLQESLRKEYGDICLPADFIKDHEGRLIPTILSLDLALSGGIPEGTIMNIGGKSKCGKSTLILEIIKNAQHLYKKPCFYIDVENRLRTDLLKCIDGLVWTEELEQSTGIPRLQIIRSSKDKFLVAEDFLNIMTQIFKSVEGCVVVLDSIAAMCGEAAFAAQTGESKQKATIPVLMYDFLRKVGQIIPPMKSNLISITHVQDNPMGYGGPREMGGNAIKFFSSISLTCLSAPEVEDNGKKIGKDSVFKVSASALGPPGGQSIVPIRYGRGVDRYEDIFNVAVEMGFIDKSGAWFKIGEDKLQGKNKVIEYFRSNPDFVNNLDNQIRESLI